MWHCMVFNFFLLASLSDLRRFCQSTFFYCCNFQVEWNSEKYVLYLLLHTFSESLVTLSIKPWVAEVKCDLFFKTLQILLLILLRGCVLHGLNTYTHPLNSQNITAKGTWSCGHFSTNCLWLYISVTCMFDHLICTWLPGCSEQMSRMCTICSIWISLLMLNVRDWVSTGYLRLVWGL